MYKHFIWGVLGSALLGSCIPQKQESKPNVVFFLVDDLGWTDLSVMGSQDLVLKDDDLWISTQQLGLFLFNRIEGKFRNVRQFMASHESNQLRDSRITALLKDGREQLWIGTYKGLF